MSVDNTIELYEDTLLDSIPDMLTEAVRTIFPGDFYKKTQLPRQKADTFIGNLLGKTFTALTPKARKKIRATDKFEPRFIVGYNLEDSPLFYEIWYDPFENSFVTVDRFAGIIGSKRDRLNDAVADFVDAVADVEGENFDRGDLRDAMSNFSSAVSGQAKKETRGRPSGTGKHQTRARTVADAERATGELPPELYDLRFQQVTTQSRQGRPIAKLDVSQLERKLGKQAVTEALFGDQEAVDTLRDSILEANRSSSALLQDILGSSVEEYKTSRMTRNSAKKFWQVWGRDVTFPFSLGFLGKPKGKKAAILRGDDANGFFVIGYSLNGVVDMEVWFVKDNKTGKSKFHVFNMTAGKLVAKKDKLRQALNVVTNTIDVDFSDAIGSEDIKFAQRRIDISKKELDTE